MNAYVTKEELNLHHSSRVSYPQHIADAQAANAPRGRGLLASIRAYIDRQRVMAELSTLSDRELADIGLARSELNRVFEPSYTARRL